MEDDTQNPPEEGQVAEPEVQEPVTEEATGETEQVQEQEPEPPKQPTPEEIAAQAEEKAFQRMASWVGRREQESQRAIIDNVSRLIEQKMAQSQRPPEPAIDPSALLENPEPVIERVLDKMINRRTTAENQYAQELVRHAAKLMDSSPLLTDKDLGNEVVQEITKNYQNVDRRIPADVAAELLVNRSIVNVQARKSKPNALAGNTPQKVPGTIKPPAPKPPAQAPVKMDAMTRRIAAMFDLTDDEARKKLDGR